MGLKVFHQELFADCLYSRTAAGRRRREEEEERDGGKQTTDRRGDAPPPARREVTAQPARPRTVGGQQRRQAQGGADSGCATARRGQWLRDCAARTVAARLRGETMARRRGSSDAVAVAGSDACEQLAGHADGGGVDGQRWRRGRAAPAFGSGCAAVTNQQRRAGRGAGLLDRATARWRRQQHGSAGSGGGSGGGWLLRRGRRWRRRRD
ncbi:hypothetical protein Syun_017524 [Stephania yunnanensis]|uniref:Uncharacterized protein n=1 Tax=Stephania yunnanensis TaxID=152371 RepID=A0AAP0J6Q2_9MAGN